MGAPLADDLVVDDAPALAFQGGRQVDGTAPPDERGRERMQPCREAHDESLALRPSVSRADQAEQPLRRQHAPRFHQDRRDVHLAQEVEHVGGHDPIEYAVGSVDAWRPIRLLDSGAVGPRREALSGERHHRRADVDPEVARRRRKVAA